MTKLTNKKSRIIALLLFIVLSSTCTIFVLGCGEKSDAVEGILTETVRPVKVIKAEVTAKPEKLMISGRVTHKRQAMLAFRVGGFIDRITVEVGDAFKKGDLLAQLDTTEVAATFRDVVAQRKQLERDSERLKNLYDHDVVTLQQLQEVETALERTKAGEQRARFTLERTKILAPFDGFRRHETGR